ncbi:BZ3500_MvSof-1268-A1-R1_Chr4-4g07544 [Microbotryum saponariae]|uniref:BZ3500_MvSof-1268-A1-R1_Chr4-4g07544 protein n=1 Tax=Microbotryum saponariae TaxID=289078 RepID=A0A2X0KW84_9BASI|nr:BZ3500_MvSof-1268-A1-R1_Chr4-4g07544 [Microbotryum saponariae]SDA07205.1 BZ3501_MvSof-1269-A2-R1_Chr4-3g07252 [Microbotryum saponariae]
MTVCTHCKARHWECERTKSTGQFSTCCSQGKLLEGSDSGIPAFRENARSYNNALSFTSLAAHFDQIRLGTLGPPCSRTWLIDPVEATDTRLGPDGADSRIQRSTLTKLDSMLGTGHRFVREMGPAPLSNTWPGPTHPRPSYVEHGNGDAYLRFRHQHYQVVSLLHPSAMPLRSPLLFPAGEDNCLPNIPLCSSNQAGSPFADKEDEDEEEGDEENGDGEPKRLRLFLGSQIKGVEVASLAFTIICVLLAQTRRVLLNPALHPTCLPGVRDDGYSHVETDRLNLPPVASRKPPPHHGPRSRENTQHYQDAMACAVKYGKPSLFITVTCNPEWPEIKAALGPNDQACNRPDLIARVFEAKLNRLCDDVFGNKQRAGCLGDEWQTVSLLYFIVCFLSLC